MPVAASLKVLVVDDQRSMRSLVRFSLNELGFTQITECEDGEEAMDVLAIHQKHLVISDLNMPKLDGLGLLRAVRSHPRLAKTAFIMLTSRGDTDLVQQAIKLGVNNYLVKPFAIDILRKKIEAVVGPLT